MATCAAPGPDGRTCELARGHRHEHQAGAWSWPRQRGGPRPGAGRPPTTGRGRAMGGTPVYVRLSQEERGRLEEALGEDETAASLARSLILAEIDRRERDPND